MKIGELVWIRDMQPRPMWGLVVDELIVYLTEGSAMKSYEVLANSKVLQVDPSEIIQFHYYNRHLYDGLET